MDAMQTMFDAAGGIDGMRRLASAWHDRVMADTWWPMRSAMGFTHNMASASPLIGLRHSAVRPCIPIPMVTRLLSSRCTAGTESMKKWIAV